ncbi:hypothetical protein Tco_0588941 [Tanacetum coccineum]
MYGFKECSSCGALYNREHCCSNVSSVNNFVRDPNPISYDEIPDSSQQPPRNCSKCGGPFGGLYCRQCTCERCRRNYTDAVCALCCYEVEKSFVNDSNLSSFIDSPNIFNPPPQPQTYPQQYLCCENCGGPHETFQCQPLNQNFYEPNLCYNSNSSGFNQYQPPQYTVIHQPPQEMSVKILQDKENLMKSIQTFLKKFNRISFRETPKVLLLAWEIFFEIKHAFKEKQHQLEDIQEFLHKLLKDLQMISEELADYINTPNWNCPAFYEDDDEEYTIAITPVLPTKAHDNSLSMGDEHLRTIPKMESDELIKSSVENLVLIPSESKDFSDIESECVVPVCDNFTTLSNPLFDADDDFSSSHDESFSDEDVPKEIYSNPLFDEEINSTKIDPHHFNAESDLIESLLNRDISIVSSPKFDSLLEEFPGELTHIDLISPEIDEADFDLEEEIHLVEKLLYDNSSSRPLEELNSKNFDVVIESFSPSPIPVKGRDILFLGELLTHDPLSLPENESFHFDRYYVPSSPRPPEKPPDDDDVYFDIEPDTGVFTKVVDDIFDNSTRELYVHVPNVLPTLPTLSSMFDTLLPFSSENDDKVFNPGILASNEEKSHHLFSHLGFKAFQVISDFSESPMMIYGEDIPLLDVLLNHFVEIPSGEIKVHIEVLSVLWGNRLPILDGSLPLSRMREDVQTCRNQIAQLNALIAKMEAFDDPGEVFDTLMGLRDDVSVEDAKLMGLNDLIAQAEEEIEMKEAQLEVADG